MRQWRAKWIWAKDNRDINAHVLSRKDVSLTDPPETARLFVAR